MSTYGRLDADPAAIERDIERTRDRLSNNLDELSDRLDPSRLTRRAKDAVVDGTQDLFTVILDAVVRNPLPAAAVTLAVLSFVVRRRDQRRTVARRMERAVRHGSR